MLGVRSGKIKSPLVMGDGVGGRTVSCRSDDGGVWGERTLIFSAECCRKFVEVLMEAERRAVCRSVVALTAPPAAGRAAFNAVASSQDQVSCLLFIKF